MLLAKLSGFQILVGVVTALQVNLLQNCVRQDTCVSAGHSHVFMSFMPHQIYSEDNNYSLRVICNNNNCYFLKYIY